MSNDLATLNSKLDTQLNDPTDVVWTSAEKNDLLTWAVAELFPNTKRILDPTATTVAITEGTYFYALPTGVLAVSRVEWVDISLNERGSLAGGSWEITGDPLLGTGLIHIAPAIADQDATGTLRLYGYGRYDVTSHYIPDDYIETVLAKARAEAYRRVINDRARSQVWLSRQQTANTSVNELVQMLNESSTEYERLRNRSRTWTRPVPGRVG